MNTNTHVSAAMYYDVRTLGVRKGDRVGLTSRERGVFTLVVFRRLRESEMRPELSQETQSVNEFWEELSVFKRTVPLLLSLP
jgi:hypothetical protein